MKKRLAVTLAAVALSVVMSVPAYAGTWKYVNDQWKYQRGANKFAYKEWIQDNGNWYYMDNNGVMTTGWQQIDGQWYYMDQAGVMQKGWFKDNDKWYFLLPNGAMATNTVIDGRQIGADGVWIAAEGEVEPANITDLSTPYLVQNLLDGLSTKGYNIITSGKTSTGERWNNAIISLPALIAVIVFQVPVGVLTADFQLGTVKRALVQGSYVLIGSAQVHHPGIQVHQHDLLHLRIF